MKHWFWLSFADPSKPRGKQFLGVVITDAPSFTSALRKLNRLGLNPGGEVKGWEFDERENMARFQPFLNRLLSEKEIIENDIGVSIHSK